MTSSSDHDQEQHYASHRNDWPVVDATVQNFVQQWMSLGDPSHDFQHILRVYKNAMTILDAELQIRPDVCWDKKRIAYAAYLHDIGDRKYFPADMSGSPGDAQQQFSEYLAILRNRNLEGSAQSTLVADLLRDDHGADFAEKVQLVCTHVSWSLEQRHPEKCRRVLEQCPELAIVQDADRLDAIGAIGIARAFAYTAAKMPERGLEGTLQHFDDKLLHIADRMKTETGKRMALDRTGRMKEYVSWWKDECRATA